MNDKILLNRKDIHQEIKTFSTEQLKQLCQEIRDELIEVVSKNGGHLSSNLGVVELTVALHKVFNTPVDQIVWDVGHQSYAHKLLTGRYERFHTLRCENGLSGFPKPSESEHDAFATGHSSTSISAALGLATAKKLKNEDGHVIAVIGDGALTGGLAFEALNNSSRINEKLIVILNDNKMSISKNVGAMARYLAVIRSKPMYFRAKRRVQTILSHIPLIGDPISRFLINSKIALKNALYHSTIFEDMGFLYLGPINGHDLKTLCDTLNAAKNLKKPAFIHVITVKGKGYTHAENNPGNYHGVNCFDIQTGDCTFPSDSFSNAFGNALLSAAQKDQRICAITAAMKYATGLAPFSKEFRDRFFDVGIAEAHAITFASGLAANGMLPVFAVYSTFLQRGFDQVLHDAALSNLKVVLAVDRAGIVGEDGETHQGLYDVSFLSSIPNVTIFSPTTYKELESNLQEALYKYKGVVAVRYPRGPQPELPSDFKESYSAYDIYGDDKANCLIVTYGRLFANCCKAIEILKQNNKNAIILKLNRIKPIAPEAIQFASGFKNVYFFEEGMKIGGIGEQFGAKLLENGCKGYYSITAIDDTFVPHSTVSSAFEKYGFSPEKIVKKIIGED